jgi:anti-sigma regulatory factor (Ser/Thr protein kinase)/putative methionine-R-sulfoxide reductase with GAF domain
MALGVSPADDDATPRLGAGQVVLRPSSTAITPPEQSRNLYRLSDPALSELGLNQLLVELLERVREALRVDTVAILLLDEDTNQLVARAAKGIEEEVEQGVRIPIGQGFAGRIAAERVPIFVADVDHADILNPILRERGIRSLLGVPLIVEGHLIGVLHVGALQPRTFRGTDVALLQLAAVRAAPAIERARLYSALEREHRVATVLQRSLLPRRTTEVVGVSVAARYLPARDEVGGDWYDVIELPGGLLGVAIGDVVGHGIRAAALMGQLRTALRSYAIEGGGPGRTLERVDRFVHSIGDSAMATAAYGELDSATGRLRYATAGHLPPIIVREGQARVFEVPPAPPLGATLYARAPEHELVLERDEMIVLYTDGLVERPRVPLNEGIDRLMRIVETAESVEEACVRAVDAMVPSEGPRDDVAIVAVRNATVPAELRLRLAARPDVLAEARHVLRRWLTDRGAGPEEITEITIAASEACANAIEHAYSPRPEAFELEAQADDGLITITVRDSGSWREPRGESRGRGLEIITAAISDVELKRTPAGTEVVMRRRLKRK